MALDDRASVRAAVANALPASPPMFVRVNSADTSWFHYDVEMCREAGVVRPKA